MTGNYKLFRIIDANLNRSREGMRVCEDIMRFAWNDKIITRTFKNLRHKLCDIAKKIYENHDIISARNSDMDEGKRTARHDLSRSDISDIFNANIERVKESLRVLEESTKLLDSKYSERFKDMRFEVYNTEKMMHAFAKVSKSIR